MDQPRTGSPGQAQTKEESPDMGALPGEITLNRRANESAPEGKVWYMGDVDWRAEMYLGARISAQSSLMLQRFDFSVPVTNSPFGLKFLLPSTIVAENCTLSDLKIISSPSAATTNNDVVDDASLSGSTAASVSSADVTADAMQLAGGHDTPPLPPTVFASKYAEGTVKVGADGQSKWRVESDLNANHAHGRKDKWVLVSCQGYSEADNGGDLPASRRRTVSQRALEVDPDSFEAKRRRGLDARTHDCQPRPLQGDVTDPEGDTEDAIWVQCDACEKWRELPPPRDQWKSLMEGGSEWTCAMHPEPRWRSCTVPEDAKASTTDTTPRPATRRRRGAAQTTALDSTEQLRSLAEYLESCGGTRDMVDGWRTTTEQRHGGIYAGYSYTYYFHPSGKRFRSRAEVARYFELKEPGPVQELGSDVFVVESLLACRHLQSSGRRQFLVRWHNYPPENDSWENEDNIFDKTLIRAFEASALPKTRPPSQPGRVPSRPTSAAPGGRPTAKPHTYLAMQPRQEPDGKQLWPMASAAAWRWTAADDGVAKPLPRCVRLMASKPSGRSEGGAPRPPPPQCECGVPAVLRKRRWWCANELDGCDFEQWEAPRVGDGAAGGGDVADEAPVLPQPQCECGLPAAWTGRRWFCARADGSASCGFDWRPPPRWRAPLARIPSSDLESQMARDTAALLTAIAHGPLNAWCFVAPSDFGLGLWARDALHAGQARSRSPLRMPRGKHSLCSHRGLTSGRRWESTADRGCHFRCTRAARAIGAAWIPQPLCRLRPHPLLCALSATRCVLQIPGTEIVIDAASENSPFALPKGCALHANHSSRPNARLELWPASHRPLAVPILTLPPLQQILLLCRFCALPLARCGSTWCWWQVSQSMRAARSG